MALQDISQVPMDPDAFSRWSFANMAHHRDIFRVIYETTGIQLPESPLDPFNPADDSFSTWLVQHAHMHYDQNAVLGIDSNNLLDLDWSDQSSLQAWMLQHFSEHDQAGALLNLG